MDQTTNTMKATLLTLSLLAALALPGMAGEMTLTQATSPATSLSLYNAGEVQVDVFGAYGFASSGNERVIGDDVIGGGLGMSYYFTRWFGIGGETSLFDTDADLLGTAAFNLFLRAPIADSGFAVYAFGGGGVSYNAEDIDYDDFDDARDRAEDDEDLQDDDDVLFLWHLGAGVEYRFNPNFGVFADGRYTWVERDDSDFGLVRVGLRFAF